MEQVLGRNKSTTLKKENSLFNITQDYGLSENAYSCGYLLRLKYSSFLQDTVSWFSNKCSDLLPVATPKVLSLGCGSGIFDLEFIKIIQQQIVNEDNNLEFTGLDFNVTDLDHFRKSLSSQSHKIQSSVTLKYQKFEPLTDLGESYDLITMVHFLHSFDDILPIIKNALQHLTADGKLLIVQQKRGAISELRDKFSDILPNQKFHSTEYIKELLLSENLNYTSDRIDTHFDVSIMKNASLDTLLLMSFCLCNDLSILNTQQQNKIRNTFLSLAKTQHDGNAVISESMEAVILQQACSQ